MAGKAIPRTGKVGGVLEDFVLLLQEVPYHPRSYLEKLNAQFEVTSIVSIHGKDDVRKYRKPPLFDDRYLVLFEDLRVFSDNKAYLSFNTMFPVVHLEAATQLEDAEFLCKEAGIPYKVFRNYFTREDAYALIQANATQPVSENLCKAIVRQVGLSPIRIVTAVGVCEQLGYKASVVERYVDKWVYPDIRKLIECLLGVPRSKSALRNALTYLHINRFWYRYVKRNLIDELDIILQVYKDKLDGKIGSDQLFAYIEETHTTRARVMFALRLYEHVGISSVFALREFIKYARLMDVVLRLNSI